MPRKAKSAVPAHSEAVEAVLESQPTAVTADGVEGAPAVPGSINEKIRQLIRHSKEQGYLTFDDINEALPESVENQEEIDNVRIWKSRFSSPTKSRISRPAKKKPKRKNPALLKTTFWTIPSACI